MHVLATDEMVGNDGEYIGTEENDGKRMIGNILGIGRNDGEIRE